MDGSLNRGSAAYQDEKEATKVKLGRQRTWERLRKSQKSVKVDERGGESQNKGGLSKK